MYKYVINYLKIYVFFPSKVSSINHLQKKNKKRFYLQYLSNYFKLCTNKEYERKYFKLTDSVL